MTAGQSTHIPVHGPHIKELASVEGHATVLDWGPISTVATLMREAARAHSIMVITGHVGVGKSFAAGRGAEACAADPLTPAEVAWVELSTSARGRALLHELHPQITGGLVPPPHASSSCAINSLRRSAMAIACWSSTKPSM